jgi:hypothetical protein
LNPFFGRLAANIFLYTKKTRKHTDHIAIDNSIRFIKCDTQNGCSRIRADPFQAENFLVTVRNLSIELFCDGPGRILKVSRPAVIPKAFPYLQNTLPVGLCKFLNRRKCFYETVVIVNNRINPCLLKHNLGNPYMVGIV